MIRSAHLTGRAAVIGVIQVLAAFSWLGVTGSRASTRLIGGDGALAIL